jgi:hypothetical protein
MFSLKDTSDKQDLSKTPIQNDIGQKSAPDIGIQEEQKKKEEEDFDKCWDEYDDGDEEELSEENDEEKESNQNNENNSYKDYKYNNTNDYYGYKKKLFIWFKEI